MSDTPEYILKQPVTRRADTINENYHAVTGLRFPQQRTFWVSKDDWDKLFVPLNRQVLTRQIAIITEKVFTYGCMAGRGDALSNKQEVYIDEAGWVDELLALFGLENKENDNG
jgi:hypothetical protein